MILTVAGAITCVGEADLSKDGSSLSAPYDMKEAGSGSTHFTLLG